MLPRLEPLLRPLQMTWIMMTMKIKIEATGVENWISFYHVSDLLWGLAMCGGFLTFATKMAEVGVHNIYHLREHIMPNITISLINE